MNDYKKLEFNIGKIKLFDAFSGHGTLHDVLKLLGAEIELTGISEVDPDAILAYAVKHIKNFPLKVTYPSKEYMQQFLIERNIGWDFKNEKSSIPRMKLEKLQLLFQASAILKNLGDISKLNPNDVPDFDIFNFSFPCTAISVIGKKEGMKKKDGTITSSGMYIYGMKLIEIKKPKIVMIENVKNLIGKNFISEFNRIITELTNMGYNCLYPIVDNKPVTINAKNLGTPQNRERVFVIAIRNDIELKNEFTFPTFIPHNNKVQDYLEKDVDEKYYLSEKMKAYILDLNEAQKGTKWEGRANNDVLNPTIAHTLSVRGAGGNQRAGVSNFIIDNFDEDIKVKDIKSLLRAKEVNGKIQIDDVLYSVEELSLSKPIVFESRCDEGIRLFKNNTIGTLRTIDSCGDKRIIMAEDLKIRKLTPREAWRLMGYPDYIFDKLTTIDLKDSALYKLAGNGIELNTLYQIFKNLFIALLNPITSIK